MSNRQQRQPSRDQGTESAMSASRHGKHYHDPRDPNYTGQRSSDVSGPNNLGLDTGELIGIMGLPSEHPFSKLKGRTTPDDRQQHTLGSGTQEMPADTLGGNALVGQGQPKPSLVQQGKQKAPQKGEASTAKPSAGSSDSSDASSKKHLTKLCKRAVAKPKNKQTSPWPDEHADFFEAYYALCRDKNNTVRMEAMKNEYRGFLDLYTKRACYDRVAAIRVGTMKIHNRWQSLRLDDEGREI